MATEHCVRTSLFGAAVIYENRGFTVIVDRGIDFGVRHELNIDEFRLLRPLTEDDRTGQKEHAHRDCKPRHIAPRIPVLRRGNDSGS
jgi:hypothetical protein